MKLELKHLAGYLPYGLKMLANNDFVSPKIRKLTVDGYQFIVNTRKPILRPLSDLTKEIENNGEKFVPINVLNEAFRPMSKDLVPYGYNGKLEIDIDTENYSQTIDLMDGFCIAQKLYEWHFDIHGLIEKGLAIDINTL